MFPDEAQRRGGEAWGSADLSERFDALRGYDRGFDGAQRTWSARRRTGVSAGLLGWWCSCVHAARAARALWACVVGGSLARYRHALRGVWHGLGVWSSGWQGSSTGQGVAVDGGVRPRHGV